MQDCRPRTRPPRGSTAAEGVAVPERTFSGRATVLLRQLVVFAGVGGVFNLVYVLLFVVFRTGLEAQWANALAVVVSSVAGTAGHRRVTFGVRGSAGTVRHQALGLTMLVVGLSVTAGSLMLLGATVREPTRMTEVVVLVAANLAVGLARFLAFRSVMVPASDED